MFTLKVAFFKLLAKALKLVGKIIQINTPLLFVGSKSAIMLCDTLRVRGHRRLLLVTDRTLLTLGLISAIQTRLEEQGIDVKIFDAVLPDPTVAQVEAGLAVARAQNSDAVLAVGGGSVIDAAKAIAACITNHKSVAELAGYLKVRRKPLPLYAIPTTAGTGSEATVAAVISDDSSHKKILLADPNLLPIAAALDETLMMDLPPSVTAATGMDALTHAIEAYISTNATEQSDEFAVQAAALIFANLETVYNNGHNADARRNMALGAFFAGAAITHAGVGYVHAFAHHIGAQYGTPHGIANAMLLPRILAFSFDKIAPRLAHLARRCGLASSMCRDSDAAQSLIDEINRLLGVLEIPIQHHKLTPSDFSHLIQSALNEAHYMFYAVPKYLDKKRSRKLLEGMLITH